MFKTAFLTVVSTCIASCALAQTPPPPMQSRPPEPPTLERKIAGSLLLLDGPSMTVKGTFLGVTASPVPAVLRDQLQLRPGIGLVVDFVAPDSPAAAAGLKKNDVLEKLADQLLINPQQLAILVRAQKVGDEVPLTVIRQSKPIVLKAKLAEADVQPIDEVIAGASNTRRAMNALADAKGTIGYHPFATFRSPAEKWRFNPNDEFGLVWSDDVHSFTITQEDGKRQLVAKTKSGEKIYVGPIDTDEQIAKLPESIREKVKKLKQTRLDGATTAPAILRTPALGVDGV